MIAILGIGNPGRSFKDSRHSAGLWCIDALDIELIPFLEKDQDVLDILQTMFG